MQNLWLNLKPDKPYASRDEFDKITTFNNKVELKYKINIETLPEPYVGNFEKAEIILLQKNPGSDFPPGFLLPNESFEKEKFPKLAEDNLKCMKQENMEYPFYHLNPEYRLTGGFRYWTKILKTFINCESDYKKISEKICCIQYFPYHSMFFKPLPNKIILNSQRYNFEIVKKCIDKKKIIVVMRSIWFDVIPELRNYDNHYCVRSFANPVLSKKNLPEGFEILKKILK